MARRMEDMTLEEALAEFDTKPAYRMPRKRQNLVLITLRLPQETKKRLAAEARRRGIAGYTAVARDLIERGLRAGDGTSAEMIERIAKATADRVVSGLRKRKVV